MSSVECTMRGRRYFWNLLISACLLLWYGHITMRFYAPNWQINGVDIDTAATEQEGE